MVKLLVVLLSSESQVQKTAVPPFYSNIFTYHRWVMIFCNIVMIMLVLTVNKFSHTKPVNNRWLQVYKSGG